MKIILISVCLYIYITVRTDGLVVRKVRSEYDMDEGLGNEEEVHIMSVTKPSTAAPEIRTTPGDFTETCIKATNASRENVLKLKEGNWKKSDEDIKRWALCYLIKTGVMSASGVLRQDVVLKHIPENDKLRVEKAIDKCLYQEHHDPVVTAWHYLTCFRSKEPKYSKIANRI